MLVKKDGRLLILKHLCKKVHFSITKLEAGDGVYKLDQDNILREVKVESITSTGESVRMYNLMNVENDRTFFADGVLCP